MGTVFKQAPLPFIGQKRNFLKHIEQVLNDNIPGDGEGWTIVDVFGGSGLLSHTTKRLKPKARVIYNDFDGYSERLRHIDDINRLRRQIVDVIGNATQKIQKISDNTKAEIIKTIQTFDGYKDLNCLAAWLLFSGNQVSSLENLYRKDFWSRVRQTDYPSADGYLDGVEIVNQSFHQLLPQFQHSPRTLFMLDPPYICTKQNSYKLDTYFDLIDFLRLAHLTRPPYLFFSSTKSELVRFIDYVIERKSDNWQTFDGAQRIAIKATLNHNNGYEDNLIYKF
jgi:uncharacterized protein HI_1523